jgi:aspartate kinase
MSFSKPIIMKFGGTSVEDVQAFERVRGIVRAQAGAPLVVVVSAMSYMTSALRASVQQTVNGDVGAGAHLLDEHFERYANIVRTLLTMRESQTAQSAIASARLECAELLRCVAAQLRPRLLLQDAIIAYGELLSAMLLAAVLREAGLPARYVDARRCIVTDECYGCAAPLAEETGQRTRAALLPSLEAAEIPVLGGFIASSTSGETTTLGPNSSDYTATLVGVALSAQEVQIWSDVTGVLTADPRIVDTAHTIARLSYAEASELAYFGAKVLHPLAIQAASEQHIPVRICNSRLPEAAGTLVCTATEAASGTIKAIAHKTGITTVLITSARMVGAHGFMRALFEIFDRHRTAFDVITTSEVSISLSLDDATALPAMLIELRQLGTVEVETDRAIICIIGKGLRGTPGIAASVFNTIRDINITLISQGASSINLTFVIDQAHIREAISRLHEAFFAGSLEATLAVHALAASRK